jgi:hypothetical protein
MGKTLLTIEPYKYKLLENGDVLVTVDTSDEERPTAEFIGTYDIVPIEEDRFSYSLSTHYTAVTGYWVEFSVVQAYYVNDHGHELEEFDYEGFDIDEIESYLTDELEQHGDL